MSPLERDVRNFKLLDFCWTECPMLPSLSSLPITSNLPTRKCGKKVLLCQPEKVKQSTQASSLSQGTQPVDRWVQNAEGNWG